MRIFIPIAAAFLIAAANPTPRAALDGLLSAERSLSDAAKGQSPAEGIGAAFAEDVILMTRAGPVTGRAAAIASLAANPANKGTGANWHSIRSGVSADGQHGFTVGYLDVDGGDPATSHRRYLAYWVHGDQGWRIAALKQAIRGANETIAADQGSIVPVKAVNAAPSRIAAHAASLSAAEKAFSDRAQKVGLFQAFDEFGRENAIHLFGKDGFAIGRSAIIQNVGKAEEHVSPVSWWTDKAIVASSGDLGVSIGTIHSNTPPPAGQPADTPFFTVWQRDNSKQEWRYIAE